MTAWASLRSALKTTASIEAIFSPWAFTMSTPSRSPAVRECSGLSEAELEPLDEAALGLLESAALPLVAPAGDCAPVAPPSPWPIEELAPLGVPFEVPLGAAVAGVFD